MKNKYSLEYIKENNLILFDCIGGSHAYGTNIETSDVDTRGVYIAELNDVLSNNYPDQINDATNDIVYYEFKPNVYFSLIETFIVSHYCLIKVKITSLCNLIFT